MNEPSDPTNSPKKKVGVAPRSLPERYDDEVGDPFEQLNAGVPADDQPESGRHLIQPRSLPKHEKDMILEAARLLKAGASREEIATQLRIEPLKLRRWETAYSSEFQRDLNVGDYHDTDAQLRDLAEEEKEKFQGNWEQVTEKTTARRIKVGPLRGKLMGHPATRWLFRNEHGDVDYGTVTGILVALVGLGLALRYTNDARANPTSKEDQAGVFVGVDDLSRIDHDPEAARDVIIAFHRTPTWEEKLAFVSYPEKVRPLMEEWYTKYPDTVYYDTITFAIDHPVEVDERNFFQVGLILGRKDQSAADSKNSIMAVERMSNGEYKIEWETSSGYQPMAYEELKAKRPTTPLELRLTLQASDFYNYGFTDDRYVAFKGTYLGIADPLYLYGSVDDLEVRKMASALEIQESLGAIVKVRYPENPAVDDQLELVEIVEKSWFRDYDK